MADVSNNDLMVTLLAIKQDIGELKGDLRGHAQAFAAHLEDDKGMASSLKQLELTSARQKGAIRVLTTIGTALGASIGYMIERIAFGHR